MLIVRCIQSLKSLCQQVKHDTMLLLGVRNARSQKKVTQEMTTNGHRTKTSAMVGLVYIFWLVRSLVRRVSDPLGSCPNLRFYQRVEEFAVTSEKCINSNPW